MDKNKLIKVSLKKSVREWENEVDNNINALDIAVKNDTELDTEWIALLKKRLTKSQEMLEGYTNLLKDYE